MDTASPPRRYTVLVNHAGQYALHPATAPVPGGWRPAGFTGTEQECSRHVDEHWTTPEPAPRTRTGRRP
ncbi:MAG TPA: MbtH family NRPS accessory protein [Thermobifida alba]|nr:MbtH family NRPS accessory protein [Thermobifida alba]